MLGIAPDRRGLLPDADVNRLQEFGAAIRKRYAENLITKGRVRNTASGPAFDGDPNTFWSAPAGSRNGVLEADFSQPVTFDRVLTMEWLNEGQRVEHYRIEAWDGKEWKTLVEAHAIGHKKIDAFAPVTATRVRLNILASSGEARIREFQVFNLGE
jgi:alpha-L-fucosidase